MREHSIRNGAVDFLARFTDSEQFEKTFREGMGLVEETANYLDGEGRIDARLLDRTGAKIGRASCRERVYVLV